MITSRTAAVYLALAAAVGAGIDCALAAKGKVRGLYPDMRTVVPRHLQLVHSRHRDILRFSNGIANAGAGPWAIGPFFDLTVEPPVTRAMKDPRQRRRGPARREPATSVPSRAQSLAHRRRRALRDSRRDPFGTGCGWELVKDHFFLDRLVRPRRQLTDLGARVLGLQSKLSRGVGGLGRPIPPRIAGPRPRPH